MRREQAEQRREGRETGYWWLAGIPPTAPARGSAASEVFFAGRVAHNALWCWELASPFFARPIQMSFAGFTNPPQSPPGRAPRCALVGGYVRKEEKKAPAGRTSGSLSQRELGTTPRQPSQAAVGPISYIAAFAWCPTVCRGTDDCGEHHLSTAAATGATRPVVRAASGKTLQAQGNTPCAPRGGLCGCLAVRQTCSKPPGVPTGWGRLSGLNLPVGPPLGALRR